MLNTINLTFPGKREVPKKIKTEIVKKEVRATII